MSDASTPAERVLAAFEDRRTNRIAIYHAGFSSCVGSALLGRTAYCGGGINQWRESTALWHGPDAHAEFVRRTMQDTYDLAGVAHTDMHRISYWRMAAKPTKKIDDLTFLYGDPDGDYVVRRLHPETELYQAVEKRDAMTAHTVDGLEQQVLAAEKALETYRPTAADFQDQMDALEHFGSDCAIPTRGYSISVPYRDQLWIEAVAARPDLVERWLECQCIRGCRAIQAQKDLPLRYVMGGGDFCGNHGPNYSPRFFHEQMLPRLKRMSDTAHKYGKFTIFTSDGNTWPVADDLWGASGTDAACEVDRLAGMDHWKMRKAYPNLTCFGNISTITLYRGAKEEVIAEARDNAEAALELGGVLPGVSNQVLPGTPIENVIAMIETLEEYH